MIDDQINEAITEATGLWNHPYSSDTKRMYDFCTDLNAMHEAEKYLIGNQFNTYALMLDGISNLFGIRATARQRAEAFLKTLGKWEEVAK